MILSSKGAFIMKFDNQKIQQQIIEKMQQNMRDDSLVVSAEPLSNMVHDITFAKTPKHKIHEDAADLLKLLSKLWARAVGKLGSSTSKAFATKMANILPSNIKIAKITTQLKQKEGK